MVLLGSQRTYEELKHNHFSFSLSTQLCSQRTYEELKPGTVRENRVPCLLFSAYL